MSPTHEVAIGSVAQSEDVAAAILAEADAYQATLQTYGLLDESTSERLTTALDAARRQKLGERPDSLLSILLLGASGAGKSELLNALAGDRIARSHHARPTTTRPTIYAHADIPTARLFEFGTTLGTMASDPASVVRHRRAELRNKILIDAPDIDSYRTGHRQVVLDLLPAVDIVLYVVTGWNYRDDIGWRTVLEGRGHRAVAFVMNKWDDQGRPPRRGGEIDVDQDFLRLLRSGGWENPVLFRTSAIWWASQRSRQRPETQDMNFVDGPAPSGDEFPALESWLSEGLSTSEIAQIQRRKRRGLWGQIAAALHDCHVRTGNTAEFEAHLDAAITQAQAQITEILRPVVQEAARSAAHQQRREDAPDTPGPYGQFTRLGRSLIHGLSGLRNFPSAIYQAGGILSVSPRLGPDPGSGGSRSIDNAESLSSDPVRSIIARTLDYIAWSGRQLGVPVQWLEDQWAALPDRASGEVASALQQGLAQIQHGHDSWRKFAALAIAWGLDLVLLFAVGATTYQLTVGLIFGQPTTAGFVLSFFALVGCVVLLGNTAMALLLPDRRTAIGKYLERILSQATATILRQPRQLAQGYLRDLEAIRKQGADLESAINGQIARLHQEIVLSSETSSQPEDSTSRLYATQ